MICMFAVFCAVVEHSPVYETQEATALPHAGLLASVDPHADASEQDMEGRAFFETKLDLGGLEALRLRCPVHWTGFRGLQNSSTSHDFSPSRSHFAFTQGKVGAKLQETDCMMLYSSHTSLSFLGCPACLTSAEQSFSMTTPGPPKCVAFMHALRRRAQNQVTWKSCSEVAGTA
jgi:hypothetical protein